MHGKHPIFTAMLAGDYETLEKILDASKMAEKLDGEHKPAQFAAIKALWDMLIWLCGKFPEKKGQYDYGLALLTAVQAKEATAATYLVRAGAGVSSWKITSTGNYIPHLAIIQKNRVVLDLLITHKADFNQANLNNKKPIQLARNEDGSWDWDLLKWLSTRIPDNENNLGYGDALTLAAYKNCTKEALMLINVDGIQANWVLGYDLAENYAAHWAVHHKNLLLFSAFVDAQLNMDQVNKQGQTPIHMAAAQGFWEGIVYCLDKLEKSPDTKHADWGYQSVLVYAARAGLLHLVKRLIDANLLEPWLQDKIKVTFGQETPMEACAKAGKMDCLEILLKADNYTSKDPRLAKKLHYDEALIFALEKGDAVTVKMLLERNASCNQANREVGNIALYKAMELGRADLLRLLIKYKANPALENKDSQNSMDWARKLNHPEWLLILDPVKFPPQKPEQKPEHLAKKLHAMLKDHEVTSPIMPGFLKNILHCHQAILKEDLQNLKSMRVNFQNKDRIKDLDLMIQCIHQINHQQQDEFLMSRIKPLASSFIEAKHILGIVTFQQDVERYAGQLKQTLIALQDTVNKTPSPAGGFFNGWLATKPTLITLLKQELKNLSATSACEEILSIIMKITQIYSQPLENTPENSALQALFTLLSKKITNTNFYNLMEEECPDKLFLENNCSPGS